MILRAWSVLAILFGGVCVQAGPPDLQGPIGVDGKIAPASKQDFFEPDSVPPPQLLPLAIREPVPPKYAPPVAGILEAVAGGTVDFGFPLRLAIAISREIPPLRLADFSESREPPLAEIP